MKLKDIAAIVTGGASGLGAATAEMLVREGARVAILDMNADAGAALAARVGLEFHQVNIADEAEVAEAMAAAERAHGVAERRDDPSGRCTPAAGSVSFAYACKQHFSMTTPHSQERADQASPPRPLIVPAERAVLASWGK
jgi:NAD(P)-dependent dehydrogenase (short-subunit alcohol dehydrogenase family)